MVHSRTEMRMIAATLVLVTGACAGTVDVADEARVVASVEPGLELIPGKHDHLVDPRLPLHRARGLGLHQPREVRPGMAITQIAEGGQGPEHVSDGTETNHQNPVGVERLTQGVDAGGSHMPSPRPGGGRPIR